MFKKYILSLAVLGLAAPHAAMAGFDLKAIAGHATQTVKSPRFLLGACIGLYAEWNKAYLIKNTKDRTESNGVYVSSTGRSVLDLFHKHKTGASWARRLVQIADVVNLFSVNNKMPRGNLGLMMGHLSGSYIFDTCKYLNRFVYSILSLIE